MEKIDVDVIDKAPTLSGKIIKLKLPPLIKDDDINSLFVGLIKLIKRNAEYESERKYKATISYLRKEISMLKLENKILREDNTGQI